MRNFSIIFSLVLLLGSTCFVAAQSTKKQTTSKTASKSTTTSKTATATAAAPAPAPAKLETKEPSFTGFTGSFIQFGKISGSNRPFTIKVEYGQWSFEAKGLADAGRDTKELDVLLDELVVVLAYYDARSKASDGTNYQPGLFDLMIYLDDEPVKLSNLTFTLTGNATAGSSVLEQAKTWNFESGRVFKTAKYSNAITRAQATAVDKSDIEKELAAEKKRVSDSIAKAEKRVSDSIARVEKRRRDSIARERQRVTDSIAEFEALKEQARRAAQKRRAVEYDDDDDDDYEPAPKKKKGSSSTKSKKKRPVVEYDDDDEDEDYEPPPKKRKSSSSSRK